MRLTLVALLVGLVACSLSARPIPQSAPQTVRVGGDVKPPQKLRGVAPVYPPAARQARTQGVVIIEATIGIDGKVKDTKIMRSIKQLDDAAVSAVRTWEFKPTVVNGQVVQVITTIPINFNLD
jgi:periplasmic protein TonB